MILVKYLFQILRPSNIKTVDESNSARVLVGCKPTTYNISCSYCSHMDELYGHVTVLTLSKVEICQFLLTYLFQVQMLCTFYPQGTLQHPTFGANLFPANLQDCPETCNFKHIQFYSVVGFYPCHMVMPLVYFICCTLIVLVRYE